MEDSTDPILLILLIPSRILFVRESLLIDRLQKPRTEFAMHGQ
jgi:hypothetical protein